MGSGVFIALNGQEKTSDHLALVTLSFFSSTPVNSYPMNDDLMRHGSRKHSTPYSSQIRMMLTSAQTLDAFCFSPRNKRDP